MVDAQGRQLEVIVPDLDHGPYEWIRVTWHGFLLGAGYYWTPRKALALVDEESLVEVFDLTDARKHR